MKRLALLCFTFTALCLLSACSDSNGSLRDYITKIKNRPAQPITPLPEIKPIQPYSYSSTGRRSPFQKIDLENERESAPNLNRPPEELEKFALDALHLVGFYSKGDETWGLIMTPDQTVHTITKGHYMGQNHGKVLHIDGKGLLLEERILSSEGWKPHQTLLKLDALDNNVGHAPGPD